MRILLFSNQRFESVALPCTHDNEAAQPVRSSQHPHLPSCWEWVTVADAYDHNVGVFVDVDISNALVRKVCLFICVAWHAQVQPRPKGTRHHCTGKQYE